MARHRRNRRLRAVRLGVWLSALGMGAASALAAGFDLPHGQGAGRGEAGASGDRPVAVLLHVDGPIGPATTNYLRKGMEAAVERDAAILVIRMDTPGGLVESTRDIIRTILGSPIPVATWVAPSGSRAASAGTYILYASHIAAMAPGTTMGAATPVQVGGGFPGPGSQEDEEEGRGQEADEPGDLERKIIEDAVSYIRSLAELRDRNVEWAERAVREAVTVTDREALEEGIVDVRARDVSDLLEQVDGRVVLVGEAEREHTLVTAGAEVEERFPDWVDELLGFITNPNVAFILMMIGVYGLFFELANPGAVIPGVLGAVSLLLALYALNVLPINHAGLALLLLGIALMIGEAFTPSFGILGFGGLVAFGFGATMLFDIEDPAVQLSPWTIGAVTVTSGAVLVLLVGYLLRAQSRPVASGDAETLVGRPGRVAEWSGGGGWVIVHGEWWKAEGPEGLGEGDPVRVEAVSGLNLLVALRAPAESLEEDGS